MTTIKNKLECNICYTVSNIHIQCLKCEFIACVNCYKTNSLENVCLPACMNCKYTWTYTEVLGLFPNKFMKDFIKIREEVLFNLHMSLLPDYASKYLENYKIFMTLVGINFSNLTIDKIQELIPNNEKYEVDNKTIRDNIDMINLALTKLGYENTQPIKAYCFVGCKKYLHGYDLVFSIKRIYYIGDENLETYMTQLRDVLGSYSYKPKFYIRDSKDNNKLENNIKCKQCNGYIFNNKCSSCLRVYCKKCEEVIEGEHECDPDIIKTIDLLRKDSVECPNCRTYIYKIEGCNQMWCVKCNTPFDWRTRKIINIKYFHNPHYVEYLKNNKYVPNTCDNELHGLLQIQSNTQDIRIQLHELHTNINALQDLNSDIILTSLKYLNNEITISEYKLKLQRYDKGKNLQQEIKDLNEIFILQTTEAYNTYHDNEDELIHELNVIIKENNEYRDELHFKYNRVVGFIRHIKPRKYSSKSGNINPRYKFFDNYGYLNSYRCYGCDKNFGSYSAFVKHINTKENVLVEDLGDFKIMKCGHLLNLI